MANKKRVVTKGRKKSKRMPLEEALKLIDDHANYIGLRLPCFWDLSRDAQRVVEREKEVILYQVAGVKGLQRIKLISFKRRER